MGKNKNIFLPVSTRDVEDVELPFMSEDRSAAAVAAMGAVTRRLPKATKTKPWVMKMVSTLAFLALIFGGTITGFSFKMIADNQVGYYDSEPGYMGPGTYFQFPWTTEQMQVVNVGAEFLQLNNLMGVLLNHGNQEFMIQNADVLYNVSDVNKYIETLKAFRSPIYCHTEIKNAIIDHISKTKLRKLDMKVLIDIPVYVCGITINRALLSSPLTVNAQEDPEEEAATKSTTTKTTTTEVTEKEPEDTTTEVTQSTTEVTEEATQGTTEATEEATQGTTEVTEEVTQSTTEVTEEATQSTNEVTQSTTEVTEDVTQSTTEVTPGTTTEEPEVNLDTE
jgi:hypothetical protein